MNRYIKFVAVPPDKGLFIPKVAKPLFSRLTDDANARSPLSFHAIAFGDIAYEYPLTSLSRMAQVAWEVQNDEANDSQHPAAATIPSSYTAALYTVSGPKKGFSFTFSW